jgi:hypothetical protein
MTWRNRYGKEEHWPEKSDRVFNLGQHVVKALSTEVSAILLYVTSLVETVAYAALTLATLPVALITDVPFKFSSKLLSSSWFTCNWVGYECLGPNFFSIDRPTHESFARIKALSVYARKEDLNYADQMKVIIINDPQVELYFNLLHLQATLETLNNGGIEDNRFNQIIQDNCPNLIVYEQEGAMWIREHIFEKVAVETKDRLSFDPEGISFIPTKMAFEYVLGSAREDTIPMYLKLASRRLIHLLCSELTTSDYEDVKEIRDCLFSLDAYRIGPCRPKAKIIFNKLRAIETLEMQKSFFLTRCLKTACEFCLN